MIEVKLDFLIFKKSIVKNRKLKKKKNSHEAMKSNVINVNINE